MNTKDIIEKKMDYIVNSVNHLCDALEENLKEYNNGEKYTIVLWITGLVINRFSPSVKKSDEE